eukprot:scaffold24926_cov139-Skeletonema_dohrnii-CCMP3373.AAC.3
MEWTTVYSIEILRMRVASSTVTLRIQTLTNDGVARKDRENNSMFEELHCVEGINQGGCLL